jgi:RND family efflux transporter MFP subunit
VEVARAQIATADSQVRLAAAQVSQQEATLRVALSNLANARILAPFSGYVAQRLLDLGAAVSAQAAATSNSSVPIMVLQEIETVKVQIETAEREIGKVKIGNPVRLLVDAYPQVFTGAVSRIVPALDPRTRTNGVEVNIPNPDRRLKPGMYARVEIVTDTRRQALLLPIEALKVDEARPAVLVVRDGVVGSVPVELGAQEGTLVEVVRGLSGGEAIILQGKELVKDGQRVRTVPARQY